MLSLERGNSLSNIMLLQSSYNTLREKLLFIAQIYINENQLEVLKEYYKPQINSNRKLNQIKNLTTLLKILEKRNCLSYTNIEPLHYISNTFLNNIQLENDIKNYNLCLKNIQDISHINMYANTEVNEDKSKVGLSNTKTVLQQKEDFQQRLLLQISEQIGRSWRDTARHLCIPEYQIDAIQNKYPNDLREQSYEALKLYMLQYSTATWELDLIRALEKARRRDLKELAEKLIFSRAGNFIQLEVLFRP